MRVETRRCVKRRRVVACNSLPTCTAYWVFRNREFDTSASQQILDDEGISKS